MASLDDLWGSDFWSALVALRREIHSWPETGFQEVETQKRLKNALIEFCKVPVANIRVSAITGLIVDIKGEGSKANGGESSVHCIALRTDMDGLPMTEENSNLPYKSRNEGCAHMCGHDGHMVALIGTAALLQRQVSNISKDCTIRLLFQPAEESTPPGTAGFEFSRTGGGGAQPMIDEGCLEGVDEIYGWHNWPAWPLGELHVKVGTVMAHEIILKIDIHGLGGHGAAPDACVDPVVCGSSVVSALQTLVSRNLPSSENAVVSICKFNAGEVYNVIPDHASLEGTIRLVSHHAADVISERLPKLVDSVALGFGCKADVQILTVNPPLVNTDRQVQAVMRAAGRMPEDSKPLSLKMTERDLPMMGGEDFAYYVKRKPGCFFFLGTEEAQLQGLSTISGIDARPRSNCICHGTTYDFNDNALPRAVSMYIRIVEDRFGINLYSDQEILDWSVFDHPPSSTSAASTPASKL